MSASEVHPKRVKTLQNAEALAHHLASFSRGLKRNEIISTMNLGENVQSTTVWRWLKTAEELGLVRCEMNRSHTTWTATESLRQRYAINHINQPIAKRPIVTYNENWLKDYVPNKTRYLSESNLSRIHRRSPVGSAPISNFDKHDLSMFLCGLSYGSSRLEGNSYEFLDTVSLIEDGQAKMGASPAETKMILNHHEAIRYLLENINYPVKKDDIGVTTREIRSVHSLLSDGFLSREHKGNIRNNHVDIHESSYIPLDIRESLESCLQYIADVASQIKDPYEQSFFLVVHMTYLQPFIDCNKRTARVCCNIPLLRAAVAPMSWIGVDIKAFREALLCVYEINEPSVLGDIFTEGYIRSVEKFNIMKQTMTPAEVTIKYRREILAAVRSVVLDGEENIPKDVMKEDRELFILAVESELDDLRADDHGALIRNQLKAGDVKLWMASEAPAQTERG